MKNKPKVLKDICELIIDCEHKTASTQSSGYPSIRTPNIGRGRLILEGVNRVSEEVYRQWTQRAVPQANDLILAREAPIGNVAIIPHNLKVCQGQRTVLIRPNQNFVKPNYLVYLLLGNEIQAKIHSLSNGATVHHLNMSDIRNLELPDLPSLSTQHKLAAILSAYDDLIENNTRRIAILEEMAQTIYQEWFVHFRYPGHEKNKMVESDLGIIPEGWTVKKLREIARVNPTSIKKGQEPEIINYVDINSVSTGHIHTIKAILSSKAPGRARRIVRHGDIIWSTVRPNRRSYSLIIKPVDDLVVSTGFAVISAQNVPYAYLYLSLTTDNFVNYLVNHATGSAYPAVSSDDFLAAQILLPPRDLSDLFHNMVKDIFSQRYSLYQKNNILRQSRDLLLPKLISGEIDVETLDIDIPDMPEPEAQQQNTAPIVQPEPIDASQLAFLF